MNKGAKDVDVLGTLEDTFRSTFGREDSGVRDERPEYNDFVAFYESTLQWEMPFFIKEIAHEISDENVEELLLLVPPGHSKTTTLCTLMAWLLGRNPNLRIMVATHTLTYSQRLIEMACTILSQPLSRHLFGDLIPEPKDAIKWTSVERYIKRSDYRLKDPSLSAVAVGSSTIGGRCDLIIADDLVTQSNSLTDTMRKHIWNWWSNSLMTRFDKGGRIIMAGTRFYTGDLYGSLKEKGFNIICLPSTVESPLWPEQKDSEQLVRIRERDYFAYMAQYCLDPVDYEGEFLKEEWLNHYLALPSNMRYYIGIDPCAKDKAGTDPMAMVVIGTDVNKTIHVVEVLERQASKSAQLEIIEKAIKKYSPVLCGVEANASQGYILEDLEERGVAKSRLLPVQTQLPKGMRFSEMANLFRSQKALLPGVLENGFLHHHPKVTPLVEQWKKYPSPNDHILDAMEIAIQAAVKIIVNPAVAISVARPTQASMSSGRTGTLVTPGGGVRRGGKYDGYSPIFH